MPEAFIIKPQIANVTTKEDPPAEKKGKEIPVVGANLQTTAQFKRD